MRVLGQPPFHATGLTSSGALSYVGGNWERDIAFAGYSIPLAVRAAAAMLLLGLGIGQHSRMEDVQGQQTSRLQGTRSPLR